MKIAIRKFVGDDILPWLPELARLRIAVFREFPYLYEGSVKDELPYLRRYAEAAGGTVILALADGRIVGAASGIPMAAESLAFREPFAVAGWDLAGLYYLGEILLLPACRGAGLGSRLLEALEAHVRELGGFSRLVSATVVRPADHPLRPAGYVPIERFCVRHGLVPQPEFRIGLRWPDLGGGESEKVMTFQVKELAQ